MTFRASICLNLRMDEHLQLAGRFSPSKVYARWKWTVRFGLFAVPLILFLAGGMVLYLTPTKYESKAAFEYRGGHSPAEAAALLKSRNVLGDVVSTLELSKRFDLDRETCIEILTEVTETQVDPVTGQIEVGVIHAQKEVARDVAAELTRALDRYESTRARGAITLRLEAAKRSVVAAEDDADARRKAFVQLVAVRGEQPADPVSRLDLDAARINWEQVHRHAADLRIQVSEMERELASVGEFVTVHSEPVISQNRAGKKTEDSLAEVSLESLGYGLLFALLVPYLFELACPFHRRKLIAPVRKVVSGADDEWSSSVEDSSLVPSSGNG